MQAWLNQILALPQYGGFLLTLVTLVIVLKKRLWHHSFLFTFYLAVMFASDALSFLETFQNAYFYISKELVLDVVVFGLVLELNLRLLGHYPGLRRSMSVVLVLASLGLFAYTFAGRWERNDYFYTAFIDYSTRSTQATAVLFLILSVIISYYHLKISRFEKHLLLGFQLFLVAHMVTYFAWQVAGDWIRPYMGLVQAWSFLGAGLLWFKGALISNEVFPSDRYSVARTDCSAHPGPA